MNEFSVKVHPKAQPKLYKKISHDIHSYFYSQERFNIDILGETCEVFITSVEKDGDGELTLSGIIVNESSTPKDNV